MAYSDEVVCPAGKIKITIVRVTKGYGNEEGCKIYPGEGTSGTAVWIQPAMGAFETKTFDVCIDNTLHTVEMTDSFGDGWTSGSNLSITFGGITIATVRLAAGRSDTATFTVPSIINPTVMWKYTNTPQTGTSWTTGTCTWETPTSYPEVTTTSRYFRLSNTVTGTVGYAIRFNLATKHGFRVYANGQAVFDHNLPSGDITASTPATAGTESAVNYGYATLTSLLPAAPNNQYEFAVEVHAPTGGVSGSESFEMTIQFITEDNFSIMDSTSTIQYYPSDPSKYWNYVNEKGERLYDGSTSSKWCVQLSAAELPTWSIYRFANGRREIMNKYELSTGADAPVRDCISWNIYATNSAEDSNWTLLDSQTNIAWTLRKETKSFTVQNYVSYNAFK